jgi:hypothetical protein
LQARLTSQQVVGHGIIQASRHARWNEVTVEAAMKTAQKDNQADNFRHV